MATDATLSPLKQALLAIERLEARVRRAESAARAPIAIVGMACRFPGGADTPAALWDLLREGRDATREVPHARWDVDAWYADDPDAPGKMNVRRGGFLEDVASFDAPFFGISPPAAAGMDPQHRLLLEVGWEAIEDAGLAPHALRGSSAGVFVGITSGEYATLLLQRGGAAGFDGHCVTGTPLYSAAGRLSYTLGLHGPSMSVDTACSSSLTAIHLACQSLRNGECRWALAAGVNLLLAPEITSALCRTGALAPDGRCKTFDASANGFARGEGCGVLVLARLDDALAEGLRVRAVVRGSGVNHDGASSGFTVPNGRAQEALIRRVWQDARVDPAEVDYVEAHGTGTELGDPVEVRALVGAIGQARPSDRPLLVGSAKTNLGHCESAAGVAGVMKIALALEHGELPPHLHLEQPSPHIPWDEIPVRVTRERTPWPRGERRRLAGVSSFGLGGTNAHVLIEEAPVAPARTTAARRPAHLICLSARSEGALIEQARRLRAHLAAHPEQEIGDVAYTASVGRAHLARRAVLRAPSAPSAIALLDALVEGRADPAIRVGRVADPIPRAAFLFEGPGEVRTGVARALREGSPAFGEALDRCDELLRPHLSLSVSRLLCEGSGEPVDPRIARPALVALEIALAEAWRSFGVAPRAVAGRGAGELAAACFAGAVPLDEALALAVRGAPAPRPGPGAPRVALWVTPEELEGAAHVVAIGPPGGRGDAWEVLCDGLAALHVEGHPIDWEAFARGLERRRVGLPTYPFERRRYWIHDAIPGGAPEDGVTPQPPAAEAERGSPPGPDAPPPAAAPSAPADLPAPPGGDIEVILAEQLQMLSHVLEEQLRLLEQTAHG